MWKNCRDHVTVWLPFEAKPRVGHSYNPSELMCRFCSHWYLHIRWISCQLQQVIFSYLSLQGWAKARATTRTRARARTGIGLPPHKQMHSLTEIRNLLLLNLKRASENDAFYLSSPYYFGSINIYSDQHSLSF